MGVLFIDEIATLQPHTQQELLTALQEGRYAITGQSERSAGAMVRTESVPCNFILVAATDFVPNPSDPKNVIPNPNLNQFLQDQIRANEDYRKAARTWNVSSSSSTPGGSGGESSGSRRKPVRLRSSAARVSPPGCSSVALTTRSLS